MNDSSVLRVLYDVIHKALDACRCHTAVHGDAVRYLYEHSVLQHALTVKSRFRYNPMLRNQFFVILAFYQYHCKIEKNAEFLVCAFFTAAMRAALSWQRIDV